jgi:hypothetical protein
MLAVTHKQEQVPQAVEEFLVSWIAEAGRLGGSVGAVVNPAASTGGARGGARGRGWAARRMRTVIAGREGPVIASANEALSCVRSQHPKAIELEGEGEVVRLVVPVGRTGLQRIVVDLHYPSDWQAGKPVGIRAYGKEGLLSRHPTEKTAESVFFALSKPIT